MSSQVGYSMAEILSMILNLKQLEVLFFFQRVLYGERDLQGYGTPFTQCNSRLTWPTTWFTL